jgi:hypothetical protein
MTEAVSSSAPKFKTPQQLKALVGRSLAIAEFARMVKERLASRQVENRLPAIGLRSGKDRQPCGAESASAHRAHSRI